MILHEANFSVLPDYLLTNDCVIVSKDLSYLFYNINIEQTEKNKAHHQLDVGKWFSQENDKQKRNSTYVQVYRVNKNNNEERRTWTSDENHCAPKQPTFRTDKQQ